MANSGSAVKFREPPPFKVTEHTKLENWENWLKYYRLYAGATNLENKSHEEQISIFKSLIGPDALKIYENFSLLDITDLESVIQKFQEHFTPKMNVSAEWLKFDRMTQQPGQNFEGFLTDVTAQAAKCNFGPALNNFLFFKIVVGISDEDIRSALFTQEGLTYEKAVTICKASATRHFMSKIDLGEKKRDQKQDNASIKLVKPTAQDLDNNVEKSALEPVRNAEKLTVQRSVKKVPRDSQPVETEVPKSSITTRRSIQDNCRQENSENNNVLTSNAEIRSIDDTKSDGADDHSDHYDDDWNRDDDDDEVDKTFEPEIKIRVKNANDRTKKKKLSRATAPKPKVPPGEKPFACHHCGFKCAKKGYIQKHMNVHFSEKLYSCDQCDYKSRRPHGVVRHKRRHTGEKPYACEICDFRCRDQSGLKKHVSGHTGEKRFACKLCDYKAVLQTSIRTHMVHKHSDEKPFICSVCGYACKLKSTLMFHMTVHSGERPYACDVCGKKFKTQSPLMLHKKIHTGEKPYVCDICGHRSFQAGNLRAHMKRHRKPGEPGQNSPPRKRKKKKKKSESDHPVPEPAPDPPSAIPPWSEQVSTINPMECFPGLETLPPFHPPYPAQQGNVRPSPADCRYFQQTQWSNQNQNRNQNHNQINRLAAMGVRSQMQHPHWV